MNFFKKFVERRRPHVIGLCGENLESTRLRRDLEDCLNAMVSEGEISRAPPVYIMDNEAAKVYMLSKGALVSFSSVFRAVVGSRCGFCSGLLFRDLLQELLFLGKFSAWRFLLLLIFFVVVCLLHQNCCF